MSFRSLHAGSYAASPEREPRLVVVRSEEAFKAAWDAYVRAGSAPKVDWKHETVAFLFAGERRTGGYGIDPKGVTFDGNAAIVDAAITTPPKGMVVTQALTSPFAVIAIRKAKLADVRWHEGTDRVIREERKTE